MYSYKKPYKAKLKKRKRINDEKSYKKTYQIILDISDSQIEYSPGDCVSIFPMNNSSNVDKILSRLKIQKNKVIKHPRTHEEITIENFLLYKANISKITSSLIRLIYDNQKNESKKQFLNKLLHPEHFAELAEYMHNHELHDLLEENIDAEITDHELCKILTPLIPRFYSISSSQKLFADEIHLTVVEVEYQTNNIKRNGVATHFLCKLAEENTTKIPLYIQKSSHFHLPDDAENIIMIGPGCGVAPFISFIQERQAKKAKGKNWLFFGEQRKAYDFYYKDYLLKLEKENFLKLDLAFSRDQENKIYVQHKILSNSKELMKWIENGAYIYVCGDAKRMAQDIDKALEQVIRNEKELKEEDAIEYIKNLEKEKRYLRDVY